MRSELVGGGEVSRRERREKGKEKREKGRRKEKRERRKEKREKRKEREKGKKRQKGPPPFQRQRIRQAAGITAVGRIPVRVVVDAVDVEAAAGVRVAAANVAEAADRDDGTLGRVVDAGVGII